MSQRTAHHSVRTVLGRTSAVTAATRCDFHSFVHWQTEDVDEGTSCLFLHSLSHHFTGNRQRGWIIGQPQLGPDQMSTLGLMMRMLMMGWTTLVSLINAAFLLLNEV